MRLIPSSTICLYSGVTIDNDEQLAFSSVSNQVSYFNSHLAQTVANCTYIPKTGELLVPISMSVVSQCNYISFTNPYVTSGSGSNPKTIYARIVDFDYRNDETTVVWFEVDYWQSFMFEVTYDDMYIEREALSEELWDKAQTNPYDVTIPEFRTVENIPITGDVEKYFYEIGDDLDADGYKIGKIFQEASGATSKLGVLVKLSNIDFADLDSRITNLSYETWQTQEWEDVDYDFESYTDGSAQTVFSEPKDDYIGAGKMLLVAAYGFGSPTVRFVVDSTGVHPIAPISDNPYTYKEMNLSKYTIGVEVTSSDVEVKITVIGQNQSQGVTWAVYGCEMELPSKWFDDYLKRIGYQNFGFWSLPNSVWKTLNELYHKDDPSGFGKYKTGPGWLIDGTSTSPYSSNPFRNQCIYIYDEDGGTSDAIISELLNKLTIWECVSSIVDMVAIPNFYMLMAGVRIGQTDAWTLHQKTAKTVTNVTNRKLMLYPFSYLRLVMPNGDVKELHYEDFAYVQAGNDDCQIKVLLDISDKPILVIAPMQYKMGGLSNYADNDCNPNEAVYFKQFPTAPYAIDSYLAQVASYANEVLRNNTLENLYDYSGAVIKANETNEKLTMAGTYINQIKEGMGAGGLSKGNAGSNANIMTDLAGSAVQTAQTMYNYGADLARSRAQLERVKNERADVANFTTGNVAGAIGQNLSLTRGAYACDQYVASNGVGTVNFNVMCNLDVVFHRVSLNDVMKERMDKYFTAYGYASGRIGIPRVCNYVAGGSADVPHWLTLNNKLVTYIKTRDCKLTHSMQIVAENIRAMFNNGVRMIKGDAS